MNKKLRPEELPVPGMIHGSAPMQGILTATFCSLLLWALIIFIWRIFSQ